MRSAPLGLLRSQQEIIEKAEAHARMTHNSPAGIASAQAASVIAHFFAYGLGKPKQLGRFIESAVPYRYKWGAPWRGKVGPSGIEAVHAAIYVLSKSTSLAQVLQESVVVTGDVDTVAAIAVAGAACSKEYQENLPKALTSGLEDGKYGATYLKSLAVMLLRFRDKAAMQLL